MSVTDVDVLVVDEAMRAKLAAATKPIEFRDTEGHTLGRFTPGPICPWDPALTLDDIDRIADEPGGGTLQEIWRELGAK
jgi:hypothetical protein